MTRGEAAAGTIVAAIATAFLCGCQAAAPLREGERTTTAAADDRSPQTTSRAEQYASAASPATAASTPAARHWLLGASGEHELRLGVEEGLVFEAAGSQPRVHAGGVVAAQLLKYDRRNTRDQSFRLDRAVARLDGTLSDAISFRLGADLVGTDTAYGLEEGWVSYELHPSIRLTGGVMRIPLGLEFATPQEDKGLVGWTFPSYLTGRTDLGVRLEGEFEEGLFYYDLAVAAGEGFDLFGQKQDGSQLSSRLVFYPFRSVDWTFSFWRYEVPLLSGLFGGASAAFSPDYRGQLDVGSPVRNKLFNTPSLRADRSVYLHYTLGADLGPFRLAYELVNGSLYDLEVAGGAEEDLERQITSWAATASWMVTGESYDSRPYRLREAATHREPRNPLWGGPPEERGWGAVELALLFSNADIDRDFFFIGVTDFGKSSQEFRVFAAALNWYPANSLRVTMEVARTIADQDPDTLGGQGRDTSWIWQLRYTF